jgi:hypothetical protein
LAFAVAESRQDRFSPSVGPTPGRQQSAAALPLALTASCRISRPLPLILPIFFIAGLWCFWYTGTYPARSYSDVPSRCKHAPKDPKASGGFARLHRGSLCRWRDYMRHHLLAYRSLNADHFLPCAAIARFGHSIRT